MMHSFETFQDFKIPRKMLREDSILNTMYEENADKADTERIIKIYDVILSLNYRNFRPIGRLSLKEECIIAISKMCLVITIQFELFFIYFLTIISCNKHAI